MKFRKLLCKLRSRDIVIVNMRLRRLRQRKPLAIHDRVHAIVDRRRHGLIPLRDRLIPTQSPQNLPIACSIESVRHRPEFFSAAGVSRKASRIDFSRDSTSSAVCTAPETARYSRVTFRRNSSCATRSAAFIDADTFRRNFERLRPCQFRHRSVDFLKHPYRIVSRQHQRPLIRRVREQSLLRSDFFGTCRRRISQIPGHSLESRFRASIHPPDRRPALVIHHEIQFRLGLLRLRPQFVMRRVRTASGSSSPRPSPPPAAFPSSS